MLFVTAVMAVLDLRDGALRYCNAGHDKPFVLAPGTAPKELGEIGAPPLCIVEDFEYTTQHHRLASGELVCLFSDGVTEAFDTGQQMYGRERLAALLEAAPATVSAQDLVERISSSVHEFAAGAQPSDDLTLLAFGWRGPSTAGSS